jgi:hypothetical protein
MSKSRRNETDGKTRNAGCLRMLKCSESNRLIVPVPEMGNSNERDRTYRYCLCVAMSIWSKLHTTYSTQGPLHLWEPALLLVLLVVGVVFVLRSKPVSDDRWVEAVVEEPPTISSDDRELVSTPRRGLCF